MLSEAIAAFNPLVAFYVEGTPAPAGSKSGKFNPRTRKFQVYDDSKHRRPWVKAVKDAAKAAYTAEPMTGPLMLAVTFYFERPKSHYRSGRYAALLRPGSSRDHIVKPDTTKLLRAVEDALTGIVWLDDAQVVMQTASKHYGPNAGCDVVIQAYQGTTSP